VNPHRLAVVRDEVGSGVVQVGQGLADLGAEPLGGRLSKVEQVTRIQPAAATDPATPADTSAVPA
jgi:hypothetical protein